MNVITFTDFDPKNPKNITLKLSELKIFGRNLEREKVLRVHPYPGSVSLYFRSKDNIVSVIQNVTCPDDLRDSNAMTL